MAVKRREVRTIVILSPQGRFFGDHETDDLENAMMSEAGKGNKMLILNLGECEALNSVAIGVLMRAYANYKSRGGEIKLCALGKRLKDLFTMTKLIMVFDHHDSEEQAIAAFVPGA